MMQPPRLKILLTQLIEFAIKIREWRLDEHKDCRDNFSSSFDGAYVKDLFSFVSTHILILRDLNNLKWLMNARAFGVVDYQDAAF